MLHIRLHLRITKLAPDQPLRIEDGIDRVHGDLVLRGVTDETLAVGEGDIGGGGAVTLVVGDDLKA